MYFKSIKERDKKIEKDSSNSVCKTINASSKTGSEETLSVREKIAQVLYQANENS